MNGGIEKRYIFLLRKNMDILDKNELSVIIVSHLK